MARGHPGPHHHPGRHAGRRSRRRAPPQVLSSAESVPSRARSPHHGLREPERHGTTIRVINRELPPHAAFSRRVERRRPDERPVRTKIARPASIFGALVADGDIDDKPLSALAHETPLKSLSTEGSQNTSATAVAGTLGATSGVVAGRCRMLHTAGSIEALAPSVAAARSRAATARPRTAGQSWPRRSSNWPGD